MVYITPRHDTVIAVEIHLQSRYSKVQVNLCAVMKQIPNFIPALLLLNVNLHSFITFLFTELPAEEGK